MSEPAAEAFEEIIREADDRNARQTAQAYQLAHSLDDEPFFCLRAEHPKEIGVFIGPSVKKTGQYQASAFDSNGFIRDLSGTKQEVILKSTKEFQAFVRDDGFLDQMAARPSFHRNNTRLWYHNQSQDIEMLRDLDLSQYAGSNETWQNNETAIAFRDFATAYTAAQQKKHILIVPGINPHMDAKERENLTAMAIDTLIVRGSLDRKNVDTYAKVIRVSDPGLIDVSPQNVKKFIAQRMNRQPSVSTGR